MSIAALNDAISRKHYEKMCAIQDLDFEKARFLDDDEKGLVGQRSFALFQGIEADTNNELSELQKKHAQDLREAEAKFAADMHAMKEIHDRSYAELQMTQLQDAADLEDKRVHLLEQAREDPVDECEELLARAKDRADCGDYHAVAELKAMAEDAWNAEVQRREDAIARAFAEDNSDMMERHRRDAIELTNKNKKEKEELKQAAETRKQEIEAAFMRSLDVLKKKANVRCQVLEVDVHTRDKFVRHLNSIVDDFISNRAADKEVAQREQSRSRMLTTAVHKTRRLITEPMDGRVTPKEHTRRVANGRAPSSTKTAKPTFFTTQGNV